jgi:AraC-like DNA-binding protein
LFQGAHRRPVTDLLSDVLRLIRLSGGAFFNLRLATPWAVASPHARSLARLFEIRAETVALFHLVIEGSCWMILRTGEPVPVPAGTILVLPQGAPHRMASEPAVPPMPLREALGLLGRGPRTGSTSDGRLLCGYLGYDQQFNPLIGALPTLLMCRPQDGSLRSLSAADGEWEWSDVGCEANGWLAQAFRHMVEEAGALEAGNEVVLRRLADLMYVEMLRRYLRRSPAEETGWLAAANDPHVGLALRELHRHPAHKWTVSSLARTVGMSRSALGERFHTLVGTSPMRYLAAWRMQLAQRLLRDGSLSIAQVAARVGFDSTVGFHRAFKRRLGRPPANWRGARGGR